MSDWRSRLAQHGSRAEWLAARPEFTASKLPVVLGMMTGFISPLQEWGFDVGIAERATEETFRLRRGHHMESLIADEMARVTGMDVTPMDNAIVMHPTLPWMGCSPDGVAMEPELGEGSTEFKCWVGGRDKWNPVPESVFAQAQLTCEVMDLPFCQVGADVAGEFITARVDRDMDWFAKAMEVVWEYRECVRTKTPPMWVDGSEGDQRVLEALRRTAKEAEGVECEFPPDWVGISRLYLTASSERKEGESLEKAIKNRVRRLLLKRGATVARVDGVGEWIWTKQANGVQKVRLKERKR